MAAVRPNTVLVVDAVAVAIDAEDSAVEVPYVVVAAFAVADAAAVFDAVVAPDAIAVVFVAVPGVVLVAVVDFAAAAVVVAVAAAAVAAAAAAVAAAVAVVVKRLGSAEHQQKCQCYLVNGYFLVLTW